MGVAGACRCDEMVNMKIDDINDVTSALLVKIPNTKTNKARLFAIMGEIYLNICRQYIALRPESIDSRRFFVKYQNGICHRVVVGIHKISGVAQEIAKYLNLQHASEYTGHCLRRTSATLLVDAGGDLTCLKRHGGWKSSSVAEGYIEDSVQNKKNIATKILQTSETSTSNSLINSIDTNTPGYNMEQEEIIKIIAQDVLQCEVPNTNTISTDIVSNVDTIDINKNLSGLFNFYESCNNCTFNISINK